MDTVSGWKQSGRKKLFQSVKNRVTNRNTIQKNHLLVIRMKGCTIDKVKETYGEDYKEESGMYTYTKEGTRLMFLTQENIVTSIEYSGLTE